LVAILDEAIKAAPNAASSFDEFYDLAPRIHYTVSLKVLAGHPHDVTLRARSTFFHQARQP
jgi:hypothetical protein